MKLKEFNTETCAHVRTDSSVALVQINMKTGLFRFNKKASSLIGLQHDDEIVFHQDEEEVADWYIEKVKSKGFVVRQKENVSTGVVFNNLKLARQIADSVEFAGASGKCLLAGTPTKYKNRELWGVLTGNLRNI